MGAESRAAKGETLCGSDFPAIFQQTPCIFVAFVVTFLCIVCAVRRGDPSDRGNIVILLISLCSRRRKARQVPWPTPLKPVSARRILFRDGPGTARALPQRSQKMPDGSGKNCRIFSASPLDLFTGEHGMMRNAKLWPARRVIKEVSALGRPSAVRGGPTDKRIVSP